MTAPAFAAHLRELIEASRERWTDRPSLRPDIHVPFRNEQQVELWYALRNHADRLADYIDAGMALNAAHMMAPLDPKRNSAIAHAWVKFDTALDALNGGAK